MSIRTKLLYKEIVNKIYIDKKPSSLPIRKGINKLKSNPNIKFNEEENNIYTNIPLNLETFVKENCKDQIRGCDLMNEGNKKI